MIKEGILVLDFGGQYTQLIARRIRELNVYSEIVPHDITPEEVRARKAKGLVYSGGWGSVYEKDSFHSDPKLLNVDIPVLGICYGMKLVANQLGGKVAGAKHREYGHATIDVKDDPLFQDLGSRLDVWMNHGDRLEDVPSGFYSIAATDNS